MFFWFVVGAAVWVILAAACLWFNHAAAVLNHRIDRMPL